MKNSHYFEIRFAGVCQLIFALWIAAIGVSAFAQTSPSSNRTPVRKSKERVFLLHSSIGETPRKQKLSPQELNHFVRSTTNSLVRQQIAEQIIGELSGADRRGRDSVRRVLALFPSQADYSDKAKRMLNTELIRSLKELRGRGRLDADERRNIEAHAITMIRDCGIANVEASIDLLKETKKTYGYVFRDLEKAYKPIERYRQNIANPWLGTIAFSASMAMARMGVDEETSFCLKLVDEFPDMEYKAKVIFRHLSYVRRPAVVRYLYEQTKSKTFIQSDRHPLPPERGPVKDPVSLFALSALTSMLPPDYPRPWSRIDYGRGAELFLQHIPDPDILPIVR